MAKTKNRLRRRVKEKCERLKASTIQRTLIKYRIPSQIKMKGRQCCSLTESKAPSYKLYKLCNYTGCVYCITYVSTNRGM